MKKNELAIPPEVQPVIAAHHHPRAQPRPNPQAPATRAARNPISSDSATHDAPRIDTPVPITQQKDVIAAEEHSARLTAAVVARCDAIYQAGELPAKCGDGMIVDGLPAAADAIFRKTFIGRVSSTRASRAACDDWLQLLDDGNSAWRDDTIIGVGDRSAQMAMAAGSLMPLLRPTLTTREKLLPRLPPSSRAECGRRCGSDGFCDPSSPDGCGGEYCGNRDRALY